MSEQELIRQMERDAVQLHINNNTLGACRAYTELARWTMHNNDLDHAMHYYKQAMVNYFLYVKTQAMNKDLQFIIEDLQELNACL